MTSSRRIAAIAASVLVLAAITTVAAQRAMHAMQRDLRADIVWTTVGGPADKLTTAYRWYPFTYPVLERWSLGDDDTRATYAVTTIAHFGGPLAHHWLDVAIDRNPVVTYGLLPGPEQDGYTQFRNAVGLGDARGREAAAERAVRELRPSADGITFDQQLLASLGTDALPALDTWSAHAGRSALTAVYDALPDDVTGESPADAARTARLRQLSEAAETPEPSTPIAEPTISPRDAAVAEAAVALSNGTGDRKHNLAILEPVVEGDLHGLDDVYSADLIAVANAFPGSRFTRGCLAYDRIRGGTYFGRDLPYGADLPKGSAADWRRWLATYPDHPGADDAAYWLGRTLQSQEHHVDATWAYAGALERKTGDGDMEWATMLRFKFMLDVGDTDGELAQFAALHPASTLAPFVRYALAVRRARANDFHGALALTAHLDLERALRTSNDPEFRESAKDIGDAFGAQRQRWQRLATLVDADGAASIAARDDLASAWNDDDGWKIGYLVLFNGLRQGGAESVDDPDFGTAVYALTAQAANQNAQTIALAEPLTAPSMTAGMRERNERRVILALYREQTAFPDDETTMMGTLRSLAIAPPPGNDRVALPAHLPSAKDDPYARQEILATKASTWWENQTIAAVDRYAKEYPDDAFTSTARLAAFEVSGKTAFLRQIIASDPDGSRTDEARALLWRATSPRT